MDEKTGEPIQYASAYLVPVKDSVIAFFSLSDSLGKVKIPDVTKGGYTFNVEYMGYKPYKKEFYFKNREEDLGTIKLEPDYEFLEAAKVTDAGNPITVKQDTLEYNASSFKVSDNAMLGDLLKKMPGIEVSDKGDMKANG